MSEESQTAQATPKAEGQPKLDEAAKTLYPNQPGDAEKKVEEKPSEESPVETEKVEEPEKPTPKPESEVKEDKEGKEEIEYKLTLPKDSLLDPSVVDETVQFAKEQGLSNEAAQKLIERDSKILSEFIADNGPGGNAWEKRKGQWELEVLRDPELGGSKEKLAETAEVGRRGLEAFFPDSVKKFLDESGYGSHPDVVRGFVKLGKAIAEDKLVSSTATPTPAYQDPLEKLFPSTQKS